MTVVFRVPQVNMNKSNQFERMTTAEKSIASVSYLVNTKMQKLQNNNF